MPIALVTYSDEEKLKVGFFEKLPLSEKTGSYWDNTNDHELKKIKKKIKDFYIKSQAYTCPYCRQKIHVEHNAAWDAEHIIPKDKHPQFMFEPLNLCVSCKDCNQEKSNKNVLKNKARTTLPQNSEDYLVIHPHLDDYAKHIRILNSSLFFIPLDTKGRATIEICGLLRFLYKFTDYGNIPTETKSMISRLSAELLNTSNPIEENFILTCINDISSEGKKLAQKAYVDTLCQATS